MGWALFIIWVVVATGTASWIGYKVKGRTLTGFLLGIFLGWIGVLITALLPPTAEKRVQRSMRDTAVAEEAARRQAGYQPWAREPTAPPWAASGTITADQIAHGTVTPAVQETPEPRESFI